MHTYNSLTSFSFSVFFQILSQMNAIYHIYKGSHLSEIIFVYCIFYVEIFIINVNSMNSEHC